MDDLTPRVYAKNAKLQIITHNAYDTVHLQPIPNALEESPTTVFTQQITSGDVAGTVCSFPLGDEEAATFVRVMYNTHVAIVNAYTYAKARIEVTMASGEVDVVLEQPVAGVPTAELVLNGHSYALDKLAKTYDDLPDVGNHLDDVGLVAWIRNNCEKRTSMKRAYDTSEVSLNPWISRIVALPEVAPASIVDVAWSDYSTFSHEVNTYTWTDASTGSAATSGPYTISINKTDYNAGLVLKDQKTSIIASVSKISDTHYKVNWQAPVRYAYMAASRKQHTITGDWSDVDNLIYMDVIESITVNVVAVKRNTEIVDTYYSLDKNKQLTPVAKNNYVYALAPSEVLTLETTYKKYAWTESEQWIPLIAKHILSTSEDGKYIFECEVSATWARNNGVKIGSSCGIVQQDGEYVKRGSGVITIFEVANITKSYERDKFVYRLKLIQV